MKNKLAILAIFIFGLVFYTLTLRGDFGNFTKASEYTSKTGVGQPFESSHERSPYAMFLAMRQNHTVELNQELANFAAPDVGYINKKFYSFFPAGIPVLIGPLYDLGSKFNLGLLGAYFTMVIFSVVSLLLLFFICRNIFKLPIGASLLAPLIFGFATTSWSYATTIYQHAPTVAFMLACFYAAWKFKQSVRFSWLWGIISGAIYGLAIFIDYPNAILFAPIMCYLIISSFNLASDQARLRISFRPAVFLAIAIFGIICAGHLYYNYKVFGSPLQFHNPAPRYSLDNLDKLNAVADDAVTKPATALSIFNEHFLINGIFELSVAPDKGIFFFSPILLFAILGIWYMGKKMNTEFATLLIVAALNFFLYASFGDPYGGWAYGPRYVIPAMAILSIFVAHTFSSQKYWLVKKTVFFILLVYSFALATLGTLTTNLTPPKVEAVYLKILYGPMRNLSFLKSNITGNFVYNNYFNSEFSLPIYFFVIFTFLVVVGLIILIFIRKIDTEKDES